MPYLIVGRKPVFLFRRLYNELREEALQDKDVSFRISSMIYGWSKTREADRLMADSLQRKHQTNRQKFEADWVNFNLVGEEAQTNTWDLIYDYCHCRGTGWPSDIRSPEQTVFDGYLGDSLSFPQGKLFLLNFRIKRYWWRFTDMSVVIVTSHVDRAVGTLSDFVIYGQYFNLHCGDSIRITPPITYEDAT